METKNKMSDVVSLSDAGSFLVEHMPVIPSVFLVVIIFSQPARNDLTTFCLTLDFLLQILKVIGRT